MGGAHIVTRPPGMKTMFKKQTPSKQICYVYPDYNNVYESILHVACYCLILLVTVQSTAVVMLGRCPILTGLLLKKGMLW